MINKIKQFFNTNLFKYILKFTFETFLMFSVLALIFGVVINAFHIALALHDNYPIDLELLKPFKDILLLS